MVYELILVGVGIFIGRVLLEPKRRSRFFDCFRSDESKLPPTKG